MNNINTKYPAIPLITCDPYFNVWSMSDKLNDDFPRHWTGMQNPLTGMIKIDGKEKVFMGKKRHNPFYNKFFGTPEKIEQISSWVIDYLIWNEQGKIIFEENK